MIKFVIYYRKTGNKESLILGTEVLDIREGEDRFIKRKGIYLWGLKSKCLNSQHIYRNKSARN